MNFKEFINIPEIEKSSKIVMIDDKKNPIFIQLADGTKLYLTYDELKRIKGTPELGKTMKVKFQRNPFDNSDSLSQISSCEIV